MTFTHDLCIWILHWAAVRNFCTSELNLQSWINWLIFHRFAKNVTFLEQQRFVVLVRNILCNLFRLCWVLLPINLVCLLLGWLFYNFKSFISNKSASLFSKKKRKNFYNIQLLQWQNLVLIKVLAKTTHRLSVLLISPLKVFKELESISI